VIPAGEAASLAKKRKKRERKWRKEGDSLLYLEHTRVMPNSSSGTPGGQPQDERHELEIAAMDSSGRRQLGVMRGHGDRNLARASLLLRTWHTSGIRKYVHGRPTGGSGSSKIRPWLDDFEHLVVPTGFLVIESMNIRARIGKGKV
jgi:hypothetical protein